MKFWKTFLGLFFVLYIPLMLVIGYVVRPQNASPTQVMGGAAVPVGLILLVLSLGFALLSRAIDANEPKK